MQAQTAECLVVGEIAIQHMVVVLNKIDLLPAENRAKFVTKAKKRLAQTFAATKFAGCPMLAVSSLPGDYEMHSLRCLAGRRWLPHLTDKIADCASVSTRMGSAFMIT